MSPNTAASMFVVAGVMLMLWPAAARGPRANIVHIMADDLGRDNLGPLGTADSRLRPCWGGTSLDAVAAAAPALHRWDGVEIGHTRTLVLPGGRRLTMETLALRPLAFLVRGFLDASECDALIALARPKLKASLVMGDTTAAERTSSSVFLPAASDPLLGALQERLAALAQLPLALVQTSEDIQVVHYDGAKRQTFGMHHDSSSFQPRLLTAFYYLNEVEEGGQTVFPAADGAMDAAEAMALDEPAAAGKGLAVTPERGSALLWYNHDEDGAREPAAVHAGARVLSGEKWGANHWVRGS